MADDLDINQETNQSENPSNETQSQGGQSEPSQDATMGSLSEEQSGSEGVSNSAAGSGDADDGEDSGSDDVSSFGQMSINAEADEGDGEEDPDGDEEEPAVIEDTEEFDAFDSPADDFPASTVTAGNLFIPRNPNVQPYFVATPNSVISGDDEDIAADPSLANEGITICSDTTLELGVGIKMADGTTVTPNANGVAVVDLSTGGWKLVLSALSLIDISVSDRYIVNFYVETVEGEPIHGNGQNLGLGLPQQISVYPTVSAVSPDLLQYVADMGTRRGKYNIGLEAVNSASGFSMRSTIALTAQ